MSTSTIVATPRELSLDALRDMPPGATPCQNGDPGRFYPLPEDETTVLAARLCAGCPVQYGCAVQAVSDGHDTGIWGGMTAEQRRGMAALLRSPAKPASRPRPTQTGQIIELHEPVPRRCDVCRRGFAAEMVPPARRIPATYRWLPANGGQPVSLCDTHVADRTVTISRDRAARPAVVVMSS